MPAVARKLEVVSSYGDALRYSRINQLALRAAAQDETLIREAAATVGVTEEVAAYAVRSVGRKLQGKGMDLFSRQQLQTKILETIVSHSKFQDITDQTWLKLIRHDGRMS